MGKPAVWFYVPNLIGYVRIITGLAAFWYAFPGPAHDTLNWQAFFWLYGVSYMLDAVDGVAARKLGQVSRFRGKCKEMIGLQRALEDVPFARGRGAKRGRWLQLARLRLRRLAVEALVALQAGNTSAPMFA